MVENIYSLTMIRPPVRGDNPQFLVSVFFPVQADQLFYTIFFGAEICRAKKFAISC